MINPWLVRGLVACTAALVSCAFGRSNRKEQLLEKPMPQYPPGSSSLDRLDVWCSSETAVSDCEKFFHILGRVLAGRGLGCTYGVKPPLMRVGEKDLYRVSCDINDTDATPDDLKQEFELWRERLGATSSSQFKGTLQCHYVDCTEYHEYFGSSDIIPYGHLIGDHYGDTSLCLHGRVTNEERDTMLTRGCGTLYFEAAE